MAVEMKANSSTLTLNLKEIFIILGTLISAFIFIGNYISDIKDGIKANVNQLQQYEKLKAKDNERIKHLFALFREHEQRIRGFERRVIYRQYNRSNDAQ